jgi:nitrate reductase NapE
LRPVVLLLAFYFQLNSGERIIPVVDREPGGTTTVLMIKMSLPSVPGLRADPVTARQRRRELAMFLLLAIVIWPIIAIGVVGGYGFIVWMYYLFTGPPGPV